MGKALRWIFVATFVAIGLALLVIRPLVPHGKRLQEDEAAKARGEVVKDAVARGDLQCLDFPKEQHLVCWEPKGVRNEEVSVPKAGSVTILWRSIEKK